MLAAGVVTAAVLVTGVIGRPTPLAPPGRGALQDVTALPARDVPAARPGSALGVPAPAGDPAAAPTEDTVPAGDPAAVPTGDAVPTDDAAAAHAAPADRPTAAAPAEGPTAAAPATPARAVRPGSAAAAGRSTAPSAPAGSRSVAGTPCTSTAKACVDVDSHLAWLIRDGAVIRGPVAMMPGDPEDPTPTGTFHVQWKAVQYTSREYLVEMPYSVFFADGGIAFHEGGQDTFSAGCVKLDHDDAVAFFQYLQVGDEVQVT